MNGPASLTGQAFSGQMASLWFLEFVRLSIGVLKRVQIDEQSLDRVRFVILEIDSLGLAFLVERISTSSGSSQSPG